MVTRRFDVEVPDGQHLGFSRDTNGAYRAHLFDDETNRLVGHAELTEPPEHESEAYSYGSSSQQSEVRELTPEEIAQALEALAALVLVVASLASTAAPHVRRWWEGTAVAARAAAARGRSAARSSKDHVVSVARSTWRRVARARKPDEAGSCGAVTMDVTRQSPGTSTELDVAFQNYRTRMSSTEAQSRFVAALLAKAFSDEQMRLLRHVMIEGEDGEVTLADALEPPTAQQIDETVRFMLEKNPSLLHDSSLAALGDLLGRERPGGKDRPLLVRRLVRPQSDPDRPARELDPDAG